MNTNIAVPNAQAAPADTPQPVTTTTPLTPEALVDVLRIVRTQISELTPLTAAQRRALRSRTRTTNPVLQASINVLGVLDTIAQAVGTPPPELRQLSHEAHPCTAVEDGPRALLDGLDGAKLIYRQHAS